jgi:hypothetical protein
MQTAGLLFKSVFQALPPAICVILPVVWSLKLCPRPLTLVPKPRFLLSVRLVSECL